MSDIIISNRWTKIDPAKEKHLGHIFEKDGVRAHDKRCDYCGRWMAYDVKNVESWGNNAKIGLNGMPEKVHCGSGHCQDYHNRVLKHEARQAEEARRKAAERFARLQKLGYVV